MFTLSSHKEVLPNGAYINTDGRKKDTFHDSNVLDIALLTHLRRANTLAINCQPEPKRNIKPWLADPASYTT